MLEAHEDIEVILRQTRVLLAPSLWQECCPLVVMEALVRGIPCVSSDACGLPEANRYAPLSPAPLLFSAAFFAPLAVGELNIKKSRKPSGS